MCKDNKSKECTGDCENCRGEKIHAPNAHERFNKLKRLDDNSDQASADNEQPANCVS